MLYFFKLLVKQVKTSGPITDLGKLFCMPSMGMVWSVVTGADIPLSSNIGCGLLITHPNDIVIHPKAVIGLNSVVLERVPEGATAVGISAIIIKNKIEVKD